MNSATFWNQIVVEDQDLITDSPDSKGLAAIDATDSKTGYDDDLETWVSTLNNTTDVVDEGDLALFPQLDQPDETMELSPCFLDEFVNINTLGINAQPIKNDPNDANISNDVMADNFDLSAFLKLEKGDLDEEVTAAAKLLTEEDNKFADEMISYLESESNVNSPEMNHQSVDDILNELIHGANTTPAPQPCSEETVPAPTDVDFLSKILIDTDSVSFETAVDNNFDFPDTLNVDEKVLNEFANLLNSFDESLIHSTRDGLCDTNSGSVDYVNNSASSCATDIASGIFNVQCLEEEIIEESVDSPTSSICTVDDTNIVNRGKRKRSNTKSDKGPAAKKITRRIKNNEASKVTRAKRRNRHKELFDTERELTESNAELRMKLEVMQKEADILRQLLLVTLNNSNSKN